LALLALEGVGVSYGIVRALHGLDLEVEQGEVVCLLGANGAGKTTTLTAISGVVRPSEGRISFDGNRIDGLRPEKIAALGVAHQPEGRGMFATLSVMENLVVASYGAAVAKRDMASKVERVLSHFPQLKPRLSQRAGTLSGGEQQMLGLARALISEPRLLMIDELSFGLAPAVAGTLFAHVAEVARNGTAVLLVEQSVGEALAIASRAYVLEKGRAVYSGPAAKLRDDAAFVEGHYLGQEVQARRGADGEAKAREELKVELPGGLWRDVERLAARRGEAPEAYVALAVGRLMEEMGNGQAEADHSESESESPAKGRRARLRTSVAGREQQAMTGRRRRTPGPDSRGAGHD